MFIKLSLRVRIFLFFCLLALGAIGLAAGALAVGWMRAEDAPREPFITAFIAFLFLNTGLTVAIWYLFDINVAKPIDKLSTELRMRAHTVLDKEVDVQTAKYLGDLAPAANAITNTLSDKMINSAADVARETDRLQAETKQLTALLSEIPVATIVLNQTSEIVLYDAQGAAVLAKFGQPRLKASLMDYFTAETNKTLTDLLVARSKNKTIVLTGNNASTINAQFTALGSGGFLLTIATDQTLSDEIAPRPLIYDFELIEKNTNTNAYDTKLRDLCFVTFDLETTGLSIVNDSVVQLAAVRIINGRLVSGETIDTYVDPQRKIPTASTKIHKITDADVSGAPIFADAARRFHQFAKDAVLVAHNAPFDMGFLRRKEKDFGIVWDHPVLDTVLLSAIIFGITEEHSLDALCQRLSITIAPEVRHTALGDAQATGEALVKMLPLLEARGLDTLGKTIAEAKKYGQLLKDIN